MRSDARAAALRAEGFEVLQASVLGDAVAEHVDARTRVVVAFPPDGETDARIAPLIARASHVVYISSTGVYGERRGVVDDRTPVPASPPPSERAAKVLAAEAAYRAHGATVLRCPGIYGRDRGLHVRIVKGEHRIPGDGTRFLSRIHVDDLAQLVLAAASHGSAHGAVPGSPATYVVGDLEPAAHIEVVRFIAEAYGVAVPPCVPLDSVHESLRADRRVDASRALSELGVTLRYPTFREGMAPSATGLTARAVSGLPVQV